MERRGGEGFVSPTEETVPLAAEKPLAVPRFDEKSIQHARPAVPLSLGRRVRSWPLAVIVLCVLGGVAGGVIGGLALTLYQRGESDASVQSARTRAETGDAPAASNTSVEAPSAAPPTPQANGAAGVGADAQTAQAGAGAQTAGGRQAPAPQAAGDGTEAPADAATQGELRAALGEWLAATNARDVGRQMTFYAPTVDAFYLSRNASREAVRAEKARVFAAARSVNVEAEAPEIRLSRDARTAVMRFRKRYQITGGEGSRSGEVLQELRWRRTGSGWKIVGERDLRVLQ
jgi:ketosteroid isomerase-like protein